jgi:hypothetical protein
VPDPSGEVIDQATFQQILEMDDDEEERDFSKSIVYDFFEQARNTFGEMDKALYDPPFTIFLVRQRTPFQSAYCIDLLRNSMLRS